MAILNSNLSPFGFSGKVPKFVYLQTDDTKAEVATAGYLNQFIASGNIIDYTSLVVVSTVDAGLQSCSLYNLTKSGGSYTLVKYGSSGSSFSTSTDYFTGSPEGPIVGDWQHLGAFEVQAGTGNVLLQSDTGNVNILAPNGAQQTNVTSPVINLNGTLQTVVTTPQFTVNTTAQSAFNSLNHVVTATNNIELVATNNIVLPTLKSGSATDVVYYNPLDNTISHAAASGGGFDPNANYQVFGEWIFMNPTLRLPFVPVATQANILYINTVNGEVSLSPAPAAFDPASNYSLSGTWAWSNIDLRFTGLASVAPSSTWVVYIDPVTGELKMGPSAQSFDPNSGYTVFGAWYFQSSTFVLASIPNTVTSQVLYYNAGFVTYGAAPVSFDANASYTATGIWDFTNATFLLSGIPNVGASNVVFYNNGALSYASTSSVFNTSASYTMSGSWNFSNATVQLSALANATTSNVVYYGASGLLTYGAIPPSSETKVSVTAGGLYTTAVNTVYTVQNTDFTGVDFVIPATGSYGDFVEIVGYASSLFTVRANNPRVIHYGNIDVNPGSNLSADNRYNSIKLRCIDNNHWVVVASVGQFTVLP